MCIGSKRQKKILQYLARVLLLHVSEEQKRRDNCCCCVRQNSRFVATPCACTPCSPRLPFPPTFECDKFSGRTQLPLLPLALQHLNTRGTATGQTTHGRGCKPAVASVASSLGANTFRMPVGSSAPCKQFSRQFQNESSVDQYIGSHKKSSKPLLKNIQGRACVRPETRARNQSN